MITKCPYCKLVFTGLHSNCPSNNYKVICSCGSTAFEVRRMFGGLYARCARCKIEQWIGTRKNEKS